MFLDEQHDRAKEAVAIVRISDENQESGYSKGAQKERIKEYCIRRGIKLIKIFEFTESSTVGDREEFMKAIKFAKEANSFEKQMHRLLCALEDSEVHMRQLCGAFGISLERLESQHDWHDKIQYLKDISYNKFEAYFETLKETHSLEKAKRNFDISIIDVALATYKMKQEATDFFPLKVHSANNKKPAEIIAIVTDKVDRLQRSYKEVPLLEDLIQKQKIELHFHVENLRIHKHSTSQEHMIWNMHVMFAKNYVDSMKDNVNRSIGQKLRMGEWISTAPVGYRHIKAGPRDRGMGQIVIDDDRAPLVRRLFEEYATGAFTMVDMWRKSKEWGLTNIRGKQGFLSKSQIHAIITNPFYYGEMLYRKRNQLFPHKYPPVVSREVWDQCQAVRQGWNKKPFKYGGKEYMFRGLVKCATTGRMATSDTKRKKTYLRVWQPEDPTKTKWVQEDEVIEQVADVFKKLKLSPEDLKLVVEHIKNNSKAEKNYHEKRLAELHQEHVTVQKRMAKLTDLFLDGDVSKEVHDEKRAEMAAKRDEIIYEIEQYNKADDNFTNSLIGMVEVAYGAHDAFMRGTAEQKKRLMNFVMSHMELKGSTLCYRLKKPFDSFINCSDLKEWRTRQESNLRHLAPETSALSTELRVRTRVNGFL